MFLQVNAYKTVLQQDPQLESKFLQYVESTLVNIVSRINQFKFTFDCQIWENCRRINAWRLLLHIFLNKSFDQTTNPVNFFTTISHLIKKNHIGPKYTLFSHFWEFKKVITNIGENRIRSFIWRTHYLSEIQFRDRPRFFDQVGHQTTNASIENKHFFIK